MSKSDFNKVALQSEMMPLKHRNITTAETLFIPELILLSFYTTVGSKRKRLSCHQRLVLL